MFECVCLYFAFVLKRLVSQVGIKHTSNFFVYCFNVIITFQTADETDNRKKNRIGDVF